MIRAIETKFARSFEAGTELWEPAEAAAEPFKGSCAEEPQTAEAAAEPFKGSRSGAFERASQQFRNATYNYRNRVLGAGQQFRGWRGVVGASLSREAAVGPLKGREICLAAFRNYRSRVLGAGQEL